MVAAAFLLPGCAGVPTSGQAVTIRNVPPGAVDEQPDVRLQPHEPSAGDPPDKIVRGFLAAAKSSSDRHSISRAFLVPDAVDGWRDSAGTRVITVGTLRVVGSGASGSIKVVLSGRYQARLADDGAYIRDDRPLSLRFELRRIGGEWRISNPPTGLLLPANDFQQVYRDVQLYFLSPDGQTVVPDRRFFDVSQAGLPTMMATRLLGGPSQWLAPGVRTAFPPGSHLRSNVVRDGDVLVVDLSDEVLAAPRADQVAMAAQLIWTLAKRFSIGGVRLLADGRPLQLQSSTGLLDRDAFSTYDPRVLTASVSGYYLVNGSLRSTSEPPISGPAAAPAANLLSAAISTDLARLAAVRPRAGGVELVAGALNAAFTARYAARSLSRPSWEPSDAAVYVVANGSTVVRVTVTGGVSAVRVAGLERIGPVSSVELSRDGVRIAVVTGSQSGGRLLVGVVSRAAGETALIGLRQVVPQLTGVTDVAWADEGGLLVLGRLDGGPPTLYLVDVDGADVTERPTAGLPAARLRIAAAPDESDLAEADGRIWRRTGSVWGPVNNTNAEGRAPFYPG